MFKNLLSILAGLFSAFLIVLMVEKTLPLLFNFPAFDESKDAAALNEYIKNMPEGMLIAHALTYGLAAFAGSFVALLISGNQNMGLILTMLFFVVVMVNFLSFHHPQWIMVLGCIATITGGYFGTKLTKKTI